MAQKAPKQPAGPKFEYAPESVKKMAARLIDEYHSGLAEANISYIITMNCVSWIKY